MKQSKKKPTASQVDSYMLISGDELRAANAVCARLTTAAEDAEDFVTATAKDGFNPAILPAPSLQTLTVLWSAEKEDLSKGCKTRLSLAKLASVIADMRIALTAAYRGGDPAKLISHWLFFVYRGAIPLLQKKYQIAIALGKRDAAKKLEDAFAALPPLKKIDHPNGLADIDSEAKHLADEITADEFYNDICKAFRLDAEATEEINPKDDEPKDDEKAQPPIKAVLIGEQAEQLADAKKDAEWTKQELERKKKNAKKTGRKNQRNGEKNGNGRKTDARLKNQIMTEVQQTMMNNKCKASTACQIVANKHLKADGKTPIYSKRTIENWICAAKAKKKKNT